MDFDARGYIATDDYLHRVYAGVLGKIIGVYLGRPFEGWSHERIERELGEIHGYVHQRLNAPLVVTDDDISGTFMFLRALAENGYDPNLTPAQIGDWWRNVIIENHTILWWGGMGRSTEHTAFLRLKSGLRAPLSGSMATNGRIVAEQIGAQIFIDGWAMICPGDPERAADWARRAASVTHDGEAIYGAQVVAAMEALAFVEPRLGVLLDAAVSLIPSDCLIRRLIEDIRTWAAGNGDDWRATLRQIQAQYGYDRYGGGCHIVPNHAVILLALLHGQDDFSRSLMIANTAGWDTDCNSGNVGCLLGIKNGLAGMDSSPFDWRGPVADRLYLPTADGGGAITDAARESIAIVDISRHTAGLAPLTPKEGARFHFSLPGSVQGFTMAESGAAHLSNSGGSLEITLDDGFSNTGAVVTTPTFTPPGDLHRHHYALLASPTLYPGQTVVAHLRGAADLLAPVGVEILMQRYGPNDAMTGFGGSPALLAAGEERILTWQIPNGGNSYPIAAVGVRLSAPAGAPAGGAIWLESLTWSGAPETTLGPTETGTAWQRAWVSSATSFERWNHGALEMAIRQDEGVGLVTQGEWEWAEYTVATTLNAHLCARAGLVACVRGLRRYVALVLEADGAVRLIRQHDDARSVLAEFTSQWELYSDYVLEITVGSSGIRAKFGEEELLVGGNGLPHHGAIGLMVETGFVHFGPVRVSPANGA